MSSMLITILHVTVSGCRAIYFFNFNFFKDFLLLFYYSCLNFPPLPSPTLHTPCSHSQFPHCCPCPWVIHTCSLASPFPFSPPLSTTPPLWSLSVCSMFPCLWFYFVHQFILFIRFPLQVRSYGICLLPTSLFHLA